MNQSGPSRRQVTRQDRTSSNIRSVSNDLESRTPSIPYQLIFLTESTPAGARYVDIYKEALDHTAEGHNSGVILIDHDRLILSLTDGCTVDDEAYRLLFRRAKVQWMHNNGQISTKLMVQLVRQAVVVILEAERQRVGNALTVKVVLTGFYDLTFVIGFVCSDIETTAIVEPKCGEMRKIREKFKSRENMIRRAATHNASRLFWMGLHNALDTKEGASTFKDVLIYRHECPYDARHEPPNYEKIITASADFVLHDVASIQQFVTDVRADFRKFTKENHFLTFPLADVNDAYNAQRYYQTYANRLAQYPDSAVTVAVVLDAMLHAIDQNRPGVDSNWVDDYFDEMVNDLDYGCVDYPVCVKYGDECGLTVKRHKVRYANEYARAAVSASRIRWKHKLWGQRPLLTQRVEAKYGEIVSVIKRQLGQDESVDAQLCVLGLNRLQSSLDVFRGETINLAAISVEKRVTFRPAVMEPVNCATMVQLLDKESAAYMRMSHAYFALEDVILVGFYDFQKMATTRRSSFDVVVPRWPIGVRDYFDLFYRKRPPKCFYIVDAADPFSTTTYTEETDETCFRNGDSLKVTRRKWRFEPSTVCVVYKSERYEIIRHAVDRGDDGDDRFRIYTDSGGEYCVDKTRDDVIGFTWRAAADGGTVDLFVGSNGDVICVLHQPDVHGVGHNTKGEMSRRYSDGCVTIEYADKSTVRYAVDGGVVEKNAEGVLVLPKRTKSSRDGSSGSSIESKKSRVGKSALDTKKSRVTKTTNEPRKNAASQIEIRKSRVARTPIDVRKSRVSKKASLSRRSSKNITTSSDTETEAYRENERILTAYPTGVTEYSRDGSKRIVTFADGTTITTIFRRRRQNEQPTTTSYELSNVIAYEYVHPAYRTVTDNRDAITFNVSGVVTRSADGKLRLPRWPNDKVGVEITGSAIVVLDGDELPSNGSTRVATFPWIAGGGGGDDKNIKSLFEKLDGHRCVSVIARRDLDKAHYEITVVYDDEYGVSGRMHYVQPRSPTYFIVKRGMSGFAVPNPQLYDRHLEEVSGRRGFAIYEDDHEIDMLFVDDGSVEKTKDVERRTLMAETSAAQAAQGYAWLNPSFVREPSAFTEDAVIATVKTLLADLRMSGGRLQLMSRTFRKINTDYGPILDALQRCDSESRLEILLSNAPQSETRLCPRISVPDLDRVNAIYIAVAARDQDHRTIVATTTLRSDEFDRRRARQTVAAAHAQQALSHLANNSFIPYFHRDRYEPLKHFL